MELHENYAALRAAGAEVISVVVARLEDVESWCQRAGITYPMLADADHRVSEAYGVYNLLGDGLAAPAVFVIDTDGQIVWSRIAQSTGDIVSAAVILEHLPK